MAYWIFRLKVVILMIVIGLMMPGEFLPNGWSGDKNAKIVVYCMTGPMGYIAAEKLTNMGYTNVLHFEGGMQAWARSARQLIHRQK